MRAPSSTPLSPARQLRLAPSHPARRRLLGVRAPIALCAVLALCATPALALAPRASLLSIEHQVMCVTCKIPLDEAESPQAERERAYIKGLIAEGRSEAQIKNALVSQYGPSVLALPGTKGFDLAAYLVPAVVVLALLVLLALLLPRWRRDARIQAARSPDTPSIDPRDASRLEADLKRFD